MSAIHIVFHSRKKLFLVDANEVELSPFDSRPTLQTFLDELNELQKKAKLRMPWWFWLILLIYCASFVLFIIFVWYIVIACTAGLAVLVGILLVYKRRSWKYLRNEVSFLCTNYQTRFQPHYLVKNYFTTKEIPPNEHDLEGLAILLLPLDSEAAVAIIERDHLRTSIRELGGTQSNFDTNNQNDADINEQRGDRRARASRQERKMRASSKQFINLDTYITSQRFIMSIRTIPSLRDLEQESNNNENTMESNKNAVAFPNSDNKPNK